MRPVQVARRRPPTLARWLPLSGFISTNCDVHRVLIITLPALPTRSLFMGGRGSGGRDVVHKPEGRLINGGFRVTVHEDIRIYNCGIFIQL